jgi:hypothetical protein
MPTTRNRGGRQSTIPQVDAQLGAVGRLGELLERWRDEGVSYEAMSRRLLMDYGVQTNASAVRRWCLALLAPLADQ